MVCYFFCVRWDDTAMTMGNHKDDDNDNDRRKKKERRKV